MSDDTWRMSSKVPKRSLPLFERDISLIQRAQLLAESHMSEGDFDMVAVWNKGSDFQEGYNRLKRPARRRRSEYPEMAGIHAELDLWQYNIWVSHRRSLRGGVIAIAGKKSKNGEQMLTTRPCLYCATLMLECQVSSVVFMQDGEIFKAKVASLVPNVYSPRH